MSLVIFIDLWKIWFMCECVDLFPSCYDILLICIWSACGVSNIFKLQASRRRRRLRGGTWTSAWLSKAANNLVFCLCSYIMPSHPLILQNGWPKICCGRIWKSTKSCKKPKNLKTYISWILAPQGGRRRSRRPPFGVNIGQMWVFRFLDLLHDLLIFIFCHSIFLAIHFAISKDGLALYKEISKQLSFLQPC